MISSNRINAIFARKGGSGEYTKTFDALSESQKKSVLSVAQGERPLIAGLFPNDEWFVLTELSLILSHGGQLKRVRLDALNGLKRPSGAKELAEGKTIGGWFELELQDGTVVSFRSEAGKPFVGLLNVFMYLVKMNLPKKNIMR